MPKTLVRTNKEGQSYTVEKGYNELSNTVEVHPKLGSKKIAGTVCYELFEWAKIQKEFGAQGIDFSRPIMVRIEVDGEILDTGSGSTKFDRGLQQKLKLQNTDKGRNRFAFRLKRLTEFMTREVVVKDITELIG